MSPIYYQLPVLVVLISLVYSATRFDDWPSILRDTVRWSLRMAGFLLAVGLALYGISLLLGM
jgi:hypothetical protein